MIYVGLVPIVGCSHGLKVLWPWHARGIVPGQKAFAYVFELECIKMQTPVNKLVRAQPDGRPPLHAKVLYISYKNLNYCWETARRESRPKIAEMDVEMTT